MTHERMHLYLEAVCLSVGTRPRDWEEAVRVARVLSARGQLPSPAEVIGEPDDRNAVVGWLNAALGAAKGE